MSNNPTAADQQQINKFARLHQNFQQLKEEMAELMNEVQNINEAADELLLLDEDDAQSIPYKFGQTFVHFNSDSMTEKLEQQKEVTQESLVQKQNQSKTISAEMDAIKKVLYGKFGDRINLETEKEE